MQSRCTRRNLSPTPNFLILSSIRRETPGSGVIIFAGLVDHTAESIKSLEGYRYAWVEEAQTITARSLELLLPTIRVPNSQVWFSWNPRRKSDAVDKMFRTVPGPDDTVIVRCGYDTNPWHNQTMEKERMRCLELTPESYPHVWGGDYQRVTVGAYFAQGLSKAREDGRIVSNLAIDNLMQVKAAWDLGFSDSTAIWIYQTIGQRILMLDFIEGSGQSLAYYTNELRARGYDRCHCILPHDGLAGNAITGARYADHLKDAGFSVEVVPQQGKGAASQRIEAARRLFPKIWFDLEKTEAGRDALGSYQEKRDDNRDTGLGPLHNWASHTADAFGLACIAYRDPKELTAFYRQITYPRIGIA